MFAILKPRILAESSRLMTYKQSAQKTQRKKAVRTFTSKEEYLCFIVNYAGSYVVFCAKKRFGINR